MKKYSSMLLVGILNNIAITVLFKEILVWIGPYAPLVMFSPVFLPLTAGLPVIASLVVFLFWVRFISRSNATSVPIAPDFGVTNVPEKKSKAGYFFVFFCGNILGLLLVTPFILHVVKSVTDTTSSLLLQSNAVLQPYTVGSSTPFRASQYGKNKITIDGTKVAWFEVVHESDGEGEKTGNDLYTFEFDPSTLTGTTTQITKSDGKNTREGTNISLSGNAMYWPQRIQGTWNYELYGYDFLTKVKKPFSFSISGEFVSAKNGFSVDEYSGVVTDLSTEKQIHRITDYSGSAGSIFVFGDGKDARICYVTKNNQVASYAPAQNTTTILVSETTERGISQVFSCHADYVVYAISHQNMESVTMVSYNILQKQLTGEREVIRPKVNTHNGYVYYSPFKGGKIYRWNISTDSDEVIFTDDGIQDWSPEVGYVVMLHQGSISLGVFTTQ